MKDLTKDIAYIRVYTNLSPTAYTTDVTTIDSKKAFLKTKILPEKGEIITYEAYDSNFLSMFTGSGEVSKVVDDQNKNDRGFELTMDIGSVTPKKHRKIIQ